MVAPTRTKCIDVPSCQAKELYDSSEEEAEQPQQQACAIAQKCVESCAAYGRVCPYTAQLASAAAHKKIESLLSDSTLFNDKAKSQLPMIHRRDVRIGRKLGEGGFAMVHTCTLLDNISTEHSNKEDQYAIKYLKLKTMMDAKTFRHGASDLATEAYFLNTIHHPNIVQLIGVSSCDTIQDTVSNTENFFIIIDRLQSTLEQQISKWRYEHEQEHANLLTRMMSSSYKQKQRQKLMEHLLPLLDIINAMIYLHSHQIIFRDLKPDNAGYDMNGKLQLFDLGLCRELKGPQDEDGLYKMTGHTGSRRYMAPEVAKSQCYNEKVDVYSFGIMLWEICALEKPFQGYSGGKHMEKVVKGGERPSMDHSHTSNWPMNLQWLIKSCWSDDISKRPAFVTIKTTLEEIIHDITHAPTSPRRTPRAQTVGVRGTISLSDQSIPTAPPLHSGNTEPIAPPPGGFGSIRRPARSGGRNWSLGFRRGGGGQS
eukprot:CAMPEP_0119572942 /NCGR_PEP_ID=MMETSP1352-20130426/44873_1 /TAXON_ID=265584 /ORGANISM="Stauroneis constricta, Strain CCMP1120" /LENGTH=481 /DNA_ID=CAMNT_0007622629 /DNA_START=183 /DNA_END=1628 /DNA_ORIENTATION=+